MLAHTSCTCISAIVRSLLVLLVGLTMVTGPVGSPSTASAAPASASDAEPAARVQVVVKNLKIIDDGDNHIKGFGEAKLWGRVWRCRDTSLEACADVSDGMPASEAGGLIAWMFMRFATSSGSTYAMDHLIPSRGDELYGPQASYALGLPMFQGEQHLVHFEMDEVDAGFSNNDHMGYAWLSLSADNGWGIGTHTLQSVAQDGSKPGSFEVEIEIRWSPLPDLRAHRIMVNDLAGTSKKLVCMSVTNHELMDADAFETVLTIDGAVPPGGRASAGRLKGGTSGDFCVEVALPAGGQHTLGAIADASHLVAETNETNNTYEMPYPAAPPKTGQSDPIKPQADLSVSAIKLNGQAPDGKDDCKTGKNTVVITLKYSGKAESGLFTTRLTVDGVDVAELSRVGLEPGQEHELRFEGVQLKKGERQLTALADANSQIPETNEGNNTLTVTARCSG